MPIDPRIPSVAGDAAGIAGRLADIDRRINLLMTRSGQTTGGNGTALATWDGTTGYSNFITATGLGSVTGIVASADLATNGKLCLRKRSDR